ncbi:hypothetical protein JTB14_026495 [Gonioctena quinquepunctata]|nr:hypothetical protein JTB14_026495 [Gonioctena quinquepunctata]
MNRRHLNWAELERFSARFGESDSEDDVPDNFREKDRDLSDAPSQHSDHESEIELCSDAEMEQEPDDAEMEQESDDAEMEQ